MTPVSIHIDAPAKINLHLAVGPMRTDGYHEVETVLQTVSLCDRIEVRPASNLSLAVDLDLGIEPQDNLVWRATEALAAARGVEPCVAISVAKRIPAGAGLAGGSSDAAATIAALAVLWDIAADDPLLHSTAVSLGADVPFFLTRGTALYRGRGDVLVRALPTVMMDVVLAKPSDAVSTVHAYQAFDRLAAGESRGADGMVAACEGRSARAISSAVYNNMTAASSGLVPGIADTLALMRNAPGVMAAEMAGSGSASFALCESPEAAGELEAVLAAAGLWTAIAQMTPAGVEPRVAEEDV